MSRRRHERIHKFGNEEILKEMRVSQAQFSVIGSITMHYDQLNQKRPSSEER